MAVLDTARDEIVLRIVYDGPPEAGKTTSLRALASSLSQPTMTPAEDVTGRTLWFDWMEYVGGRFEGSRIRCQIVSVPGQRSLARRRHLLLRSADVVVFVGDSSPAAWDQSVEYLFELRQLLGEARPAVGVVVQANKRDVPDAIHLDDLRARLGDARWSVGVVESSASDGTGIREAFVYAVRLALDRVREQMQRGDLATGAPDLASPEQLLALLQGDAPAAPPRVHAVAPTDSVVAQLLRGVLDEANVASVASRPGEAPRAPDPSVPSGAVWPPVEGRALLHEIAHLELRPRRLPTGAWVAGLGTGWRVVSARDAVFETIDLGRSALIQWARLHAACAGVLSARRCIVLAATGDGGWRLWQIVRAEESLRDLVGAALGEDPPERLAPRLLRAAQLLLDVDARRADAHAGLWCTLDTVGPTDAAGGYIGLMPEAAQALPHPPLSPAALLDRELGPLVAQQAPARRVALGRALDRAPRPGVHAETVIASLARLLA